MSGPRIFNFDLSRREFILGAFAAGLFVSLPLLAKAADGSKAAPPATPPATPPIPTKPLTLKVNGQVRTVQVDPRTTLLDLLRENLQLTGAKKGCDHGQCGACTVLVNGKRINSCLSFALQNEGKEITTIEGLAKSGALHPMQAAFIQHDAYQCGFCTPGQILSAVALLGEEKAGRCGSSEKETRECMSGNICRCGAYRNILTAISEVRGEGGTHAAI